MSTRWLYTFQAIDPKDSSKTWEVGIPEQLFRLLQNKGHEKAIARLVLVHEVLEGGTVELRGGWSRPGKEEGCYVYIGRPARDFKSLSIETPAPKNMAFLVFVLPDGSIDEWTWRLLSEEKGEEDSPEGIKGDVIWPPNKT